MYLIVSVYIRIVLSMCMNGLTEVKSCGPEEFTCRGKGGECVPLTWMCDDNADCSDGSDEKACSKGFNLQSKSNYVDKRLLNTYNTIEQGFLRLRVP